MTRYLAMRDHSRFELEQKLLRSFDSELVARVLAEADEFGWLASEEDIAERLAAAYSRQNKSRRYIEAQLRKRRLPMLTVDAELELEKARQLVTRKFGLVKELSFEERAKAFRFLRYRGFDDRSIRQVLNEK